MNTLSRIWKKAFGSIYSAIASNIYEPLIVHIAFRVIGGRLNDAVRLQGMRAVAGCPGAPILDLPVGTGYFTTHVALRHDEAVVGADIAWGMVVESRKKAISARAKLMFPVQCDADHLPFADSSFGAVLCTNGLQVMPSLRSPLGEMARVTRPGGKIYASIPTIPIGRLLPRSVSRRLPVFFRAGRDLAEGFVAAGFEISAFKRMRFAYLIEAVRAA